MSTVRRRLLLAATLAASALAPREAGAGGDSMASTRGGEMIEREHRIDLRFEPGYATLVVRRTVHNPSQRPDEAAYGLLVPEQAVATRLRIRAGKSRWYTGDLLATEVAADRYHALTGMDPTRHPTARRPAKDPALLAWEAPDELSLHVFPVDAGRDRTVEYTLEMPATWVDGRWYIDLPDTGLDDLPADLSLRTDAGRLYVDDRVVASGHRVLLDEPHTIALAPRERPVAALELASLPTGQDRAYVHWRLSLTRHLAPIPRDLRVVIALDLSRSLPTAVDVAQRRAAMAYLEHLRQPHLGGGTGTGTGYGRASGTGFSGRLDRQTWLEDQLDSFRQNCRSTDALTITLETTYDEIVDITAPDLSLCVREATWSLLLPTGDFTDPRARWTVTLPPA